MAVRELGDVIPVPAQVRPDRAADFTIHSGTAIRTARRRQSARALAEILRSATGYAVPVSETDGSIVLELAEVEGGDEAYELDIAPDGVTVRADAPAGLFAAVQTLRQYVPRSTRRGRRHGAPAAGSRTGRASSTAASMLDVARHFFTVDEVKSYIDAVVQFKINHLHLHLTDDQGWRLEIDGWPRLTEVSGAAGTGVDGAGPGFFTKDRLHRPGRVRRRPVRHDRARDRHARPHQRGPVRLPRADQRRRRDRARAPTPRSATARWSPARSRRTRSSRTSSARSPP